MSSCGNVSGEGLPAEKDTESGVCGIFKISLMVDDCSSPILSEKLIFSKIIHPGLQILKTILPEFRYSLSYHKAINMAIFNSTKNKQGQICPIC